MVAVVIAGLTTAVIGDVRMGPRNWPQVTAVWEQIGFWANGLILLIGALIAPSFLIKMPVVGLGYLLVVVIAAFRRQGRHPFRHAAGDQQTRRHGLDQPTPENPGLVGRRARCGHADPDAQPCRNRRTRRGGTRPFGSAWLRLRAGDAPDQRREPRQGHPMAWSGPALDARSSSARTYRRGDHGQGAKPCSPPCQAARGRPGGASRHRSRLSGKVGPSRAPNRRRYGAFRRTSAHRPHHPRRPGKTLGAQTLRGWCDRHDHHPHPAHPGRTPRRRDTPSRSRGLRGDDVGLARFSALVSRPSCSCSVGSAWRGHSPACSHDDSMSSWRPKACSRKSAGSTPSAWRH